MILAILYALMVFFIGYFLGRTHQMVASHKQWKGVFKKECENHDKIVDHYEKLLMQSGDEWKNPKQ